MVMLLNSCLTFKKFFALFLAAVCIVFSLCGCKKETLYLPLRIDCYEGETLVQSYINEFNEFGFVTSESLVYHGVEYRTENTKYTYDEKGVLLSAVHTISDIETEYTAEKVTEYKYNLTSKDGYKMVLIFDGKGHIVYKMVEGAYTLENAYTYDKSGKPISLKTQQISPSGNSKITDYIITFTSNNTYEYFTVGDNANRFVVTCEILKR